MTQMSLKILDHLKRVVQTTNTLKVSDQNLILRRLCTIEDYVAFTPVTTNTREISKIFAWLIFKKVYLAVFKFANRIIKSLLNNGQSIARVVNMSTPLLLTS